MEFDTIRGKCSKKNCGARCPSGASHFFGGFENLLELGERPGEAGTAPLERRATGRSRVSGLEAVLSSSVRALGLRQQSQIGQIGRAETTMAGLGSPRSTPTLRAGGQFFLQTSNQRLLGRAALLRSRPRIASSFRLGPTDV